MMRRFDVCFYCNDWKYEIYKFTNINISYLISRSSVSIPWTTDECARRTTIKKFHRTTTSIFKDLHRSKRTKKEHKCCRYRMNVNICIDKKQLWVEDTCIREYTFHNVIMYILLRMCIKSKTVSWPTPVAVLPSKSTLVKIPEPLLKISTAPPPCLSNHVNKNDQEMW